MTAFLTFAETPSAGQAGHIASNTDGKLGRTRVRATDAAVDAALAVCNGATPGKTVKQPTTAAEAAACLGILLDPEYRNEIGAAAQYAAGDPATILFEGKMWANSEGTVAYGDPVYVRHTSDGGSNTVRGTLRNSSDGSVVLDTTSTVEGKYRVVLSNGIVEEAFEYDTDGSATANEITTGLVAAIDASANFAAAGTAEVTILPQVGSEIRVVEFEGPTAAATALLTIVDNQKAARLPGASFAQSRTGAGVVKIELALSGGE